MSAALDRAVPPAGSTSFFQVGYVVPDLLRAVDFFTDTLGAPPFLVLEDVQLSDLTFHGRPFQPRDSLAFSYLGHLQFELIQPLEDSDESTYTQFLDRHPQGGIHHTALRVETIEQGLHAIGATGDDVVQAGRFGEGTRFAYLDVASATGALVEIIELDATGLEMFEALRRGETA